MPERARLGPHERRSPCRSEDGSLGPWCQGDRPNSTSAARSLQNSPARRRRCARFPLPPSRRAARGSWPGEQPVHHRPVRSLERTTRIGERGILDSPAWRGWRDGGHRSDKTPAQASKPEPRGCTRPVREPSAPGERAPRASRPAPARRRAGGAVRAIPGPTRPRRWPPAHGCSQRPADPRRRAPPVAVVAPRRGPRVELGHLWRPRIARQELPDRDHSATKGCRRRGRVVHGVVRDEAFTWRQGTARCGPAVTGNPEIPPWAMTPGFVKHKGPLRPREHERALHGGPSAAFAAGAPGPAPKPLTKSAPALRYNSPVSIGVFFDERHGCWSVRAHVNRPATTTSCRASRGPGATLKPNHGSWSLEARSHGVAADPVAVALRAGHGLELHEPLPPAAVPRRASDPAEGPAPSLLLLAEAPGEKRATSSVAKRTDRPPKRVTDLTKTAPSAEPSLNDARDLVWVDARVGPRRSHQTAPLPACSCRSHRPGDRPGPSRTTRRWDKAIAPALHRQEAPR